MTNVNGTHPIHRASII